jgi:pimeloyl-ACP methyl ester carboxylesterase
MRKAAIILLLIVSSCQAFARAIGPQGTFTSHHPKASLRNVSALSSLRAGSLSDSSIEEIYDGKNDNQAPPRTANDDDGTPVIRRRATTLWNSICKSKITAAILSFFLGCRIGSGATRARLQYIQEAMEETASYYAANARSYPRPYLLSTILFAVVMREAWRSLPAWVKPQILARRRATEDTAVTELDHEDMTSLGVIASKLQTFFAVASEKIRGSVSDVDQRVGYLDFVALVKLLGALKEERAVERDRRYTEDDLQVEHPQTVMTGLDEAFEFADWAYMTNGMMLRSVLKQQNFTLVRRESIALPGSASHYIAINKERKVAYIGIRGSAGFADLLTDCCMRAVPYALRGPFVEGGPATIWAHEGISLTAKRLADDVETLIEELLFPNGYRLIITGHSMGASVACMLGMLLRSRLGLKYPRLLKDDGSLIKVLAFACPPVLDHDAALACTSFTTTIVNNSDIIPRWSLSNILILMEYLKAVNKKLEEKRLRPKDFKSLVAFTRMLFCKRGSPEPFMTIDEIRSTMLDAYAKVDLKDPDHLYVPGKVIHMYDLWSKEGYEQGVNASNAEGNANLRVAERVHVSNGTSNVLRYIEIDSRMTSDHYSEAYRKSIRDLLSIK